MEVVWTETTLETFFKVVDYLQDHWSSKEIETFENNFDDLFKELARLIKYAQNQNYLVIENV